MINERIARLRAQQNMSQQQVAEALGMARSTYTSLEMGARELTYKDMENLAKLFDISINELLERPQSRTPGFDNSEEDVPYERFRQILLYMLEKIGAKPNVGETVIYKLLYFIDMEYYEKTYKKLIGLRYQKNYYGPTPVDFKKYTETMQKNGDIDILSGQYFKYRQRKYMPSRSADFASVDLAAADLKYIDDVLTKLADKTATELTELSHQDPPWRRRKIGEELQYNDVFDRNSNTWPI